jgi:hypothetical protein
MGSAPRDDRNGARFAPITPRLADGSAAAALDDSFALVRCLAGVDDAWRR